MPDEPVLNKMLHEIIEAANRSIAEGETERHFSDMMNQFFGIEKVLISTIDRAEGQKNELYGYVSNTRKIYVDNQLSEYSSFPELIKYKNRGFKSCALVPIVVNGKVVSIVEMLSSLENKFSNELVNSAAFGAYLTGLTLLYKSESERNVKLASYFDTAFNSADPQLLVSQDGKIVKANNAARNQIFLPTNQNSKIEEIIGLNFSQLLSLSKKGQSTIPFQAGQIMRFYKVSTNPVGERLVHVLLQDVSDLRRLGLLLESMDQESFVSALYLDNNHIVKCNREHKKSNRI